MNAANDTAPRANPNHWKGSKYASGRKPAEIAKLIRADIKAAQASGALPKCATFGVRSGYSTHTPHVDILIKGAPFEIHSVKRVRQDLRLAAAHPIAPWMSDAARALVDRVEAIANAYNYDRSDLESDYHNCAFFLSVNYDTTEQAASRARIVETLRAAYA